MRPMMQVRRTKERASEIFPGLKKMLYSMISSGNMTSAGMTVKNFTFWGKKNLVHTIKMRKFNPGANLWL